MLQQMCVMFVNIKDFSDEFIIIFNIIINDLIMRFSIHAFFSHQISLEIKINI